MFELRLALPLIASLTLGCASTAAAQPKTEHDRPVPATEPRAEVTLRLDLIPSQDCEERFDLALYEDRRIELVQWGQGSGCVGRTARIRYLSAKLDEEALLDKVRELAKQASKEAK